MTHATVIYTGSIWTGTADDHWVEAFAVQNGMILATGTLDEVKAAVEADYEIVEYSEGIMMPGLIDGHLHLSLAGTQLAHELPLAPSDDADTILQKVAEWTTRVEPGE
ncbi:MAG TPA: hypothetical protein VIG71_06995 [Enteractinococcus sp.]